MTKPVGDHRKHAVLHPHLSKMDRWKGKYALAIQIPTIPTLKDAEAAVDPIILKTKSVRWFNKKKA
jgi:hypothetical protein